jgi:hypothetical protein
MMSKGSRDEPAKKECGDGGEDDYGHDETRCDEPAVLHPPQSAADPAEHGRDAIDGGERDLDVGRLGFHARAPNDGPNPPEAKSSSPTTVRRWLTAK